MIRRIVLLLTALMLALSMLVGGAGAAFGDPDCAPPTKPSCHDPGGPPGPGNFVGNGGGSKNANH